MQARMLLCTLILAASGSIAAAEVYSFDRAHTQITFFIDHLGFSRSSGRFKVTDGTFRFDRADWPSASADVQIDAASIDLGDDAWNERMREKDFFDVERHPRILFRSTRVTDRGDGRLSIEGDLTLLGVTRSVTLDTQFNKAGAVPQTDLYMAGFSANTRLKRSEFGMQAGIPFVGDEVELRIEVEGVRQ